MLFLWTLIADLHFQTGTHQFTLNPGEYTVTCKGAQGGRGFKNGELDQYGGKGASASGIMEVRGSPKIFFANVGGQGQNNAAGSSPGGYNGGGTSGSDNYGEGNDGPGGGGGATDLRIDDNSLDNRIIVAAGGSGAAGICGGAPGGTLNGQKATNNGRFSSSSEVTQSLGNADGVGSKGPNSNSIPGSGGGGGWRGGIAGSTATLKQSSYKAVAQSGSSYISGYEGCTKNGKMEFKSGVMESDQNSGDGSLEIIANKCFDGYNMHEKECIQPCPSGYFGLDGICTRCVSPCKTCTSETSCLTCVETYYFYENKCMNPCLDGYIGINDKCEKCTWPCKTCVSNRDTCTSCENTFSLYNSQCRSSCPGGYYSYEGKCIDSCPKGTYISDGKCEKCDYLCETCSNQKDHCDTCVGDSFMYDNYCYRNCYEINNVEGEHFGLDQNNHVCKKCSDQNCIDCSNDFSECTKCREFYYTDSGKCIREQTFIFTNSKEFSDSKVFTKSSPFSSSFVFTHSSPFSETLKFSKTSPFSLSTKFTHSSPFSKTSGFTQTLPFSVSAQFTKSSPFSETSKFSKTSPFSLSTEFTHSSPFSETSLFTQSLPFQISAQFTKSSSFSQTSKFSKTSPFSLSTEFTHSSPFSETTRFTQTLSFSVSTQFTKSSPFSETLFTASTFLMTSLDTSTLLYTISFDFGNNYWFSQSSFSSSKLIKTSLFSSDIKNSQNYVSYSHSFSLLTSTLFLSHSLIAFQTPKFSEITKETRTNSEDEKIVQRPTNNHEIIESNSKTKGAKTPIIVGILAALLITIGLIVVGLFIILKKKKQNRNITNIEKNKQESDLISDEHFSSNIQYQDQTDRDLDFWL